MKTMTVEEIDRARLWLRQVQVGEPVHHRNLTVFPLFGAAEPAPDRSRAYRLLSEAVAAQEARVEEVDEGGQVPFLGVANAGTVPILVPEGEILIGAKQNRTVNLTVLVAAQSTFKLPVSCVEAGRWNYVSRHFEPAAYAHPKLRYLKTRSAQRSRSEYASEGVAHSDQGEVWEEVDQHLHALAVESTTSSMTDSYSARADDLDDYRSEIRLPESACGFLAAKGDKVVGLDLFDSPLTMRELWPRLADSYFVEAMKEGRDVELSTREAAAGFLALVAQRLIAASSQPDLGWELELDGDDLAGSALWFEGALCHLSAFAA